MKTAVATMLPINNALTNPFYVSNLLNTVNSIRKWRQCKFHILFYGNIILLKWIFKMFFKKINFIAFTTVSLLQIARILVNFIRKSISNLIVNTVLKCMKTYSNFFFLFEIFYKSRGYYSSFNINDSISVSLLVLTL